MAGPAVGGKDAVYAGCELDTNGVERYRLSVAQVRFFLDWFILSVFASSAVQSFGFGQRLLSERELWCSV